MIRHHGKNLIPDSVSSTYGIETPRTPPQQELDAILRSRRTNGQIQHQKDCRQVAIAG